MMALVSLPFLLESRFGFTHVQRGLFMTPIAVAAPVAGRLVERVSAGTLAGIGMSAAALEFFKARADVPAAK